MKRISTKSIKSKTEGLDNKAVTWVNPADRILSAFIRTRSQSTVKELNSMHKKWGQSLMALKKSLNNLEDASKDMAEFSDLEYPDFDRWDEFNKALEVLEDAKEAYEDEYLKAGKMANTVHKHTEQLIRGLPELRSITHTTFKDLEEKSMENS